MKASAFVDPRTDPQPPVSVPRPPSPDAGDVRYLVQLCRDGRLYEVERWIQQGRPLQAAEAPRKGRRPSTALEVALERGEHALVLLLLCNGYDPNQEPECPLGRALRARRSDHLDLLLAWGADPQCVELEDLFGSYNAGLFTRFRDLGVDLTAQHALAEALGYHTSNKPLFGFAKRHRARDPAIQTELNMALGHHASEGNAKGVQLCLWAGADPHAPAPNLRYWDDDDDEDVDGLSAVHHACQRGDAEILHRLGPDPSRDNFDQLYCIAESGAVIELLAELALPQDIGAVLDRQLWWLSLTPSSWRSLSGLRALFQAGARWEQCPRETIASVRQSLLKLHDLRFVDAMKLLAEDGYCSSDILHEVGRTTAMRARMRRVGFLPPDHKDAAAYHPPRPTRSKEVLAKFGVAIPKPKQIPVPLPREVVIGPIRPNGERIQLDRSRLFGLVWSRPVTKLAGEWGLSGRGLAKACRRLKIPVPPRGHWAKVAAGRQRRRPRLAALSAGEAEVIVIRAPAAGLDHHDP